MRMIKESGGERFECARSLNQSLTFVTAQQEFQRRGIPLEEAQQRSLQLVTADGLYTNLALLLSDQCPFTIKAARFSGTDKYIFQDRAEFSGLHRIDRRDYPDEALREALLNAAIHRDYSYHSSILISIFDDRMEIVSMGGLMPGLTQGDIMMGISLQRNENLASVFYRLQLVEAFGTGLPRINLAYKKAARKPEIHVSENAFKIVLPNQNTSCPAKTKKLAGVPTSLERQKPSSETTGIKQLYKVSGCYDGDEGHGKILRIPCHKIVGINLHSRLILHCILKVLPG